MAKKYFKKILGKDLHMSKQCCYLCSESKLLNIMYTIRAKEGNVDLSKFDYLKKVISESNNESSNIEEYNYKVFCKFKELVSDYEQKLNYYIVNELGLIQREKPIQLQYFLNSKGEHCRYYFGHGRASLQIDFYLSLEEGSRRLSYDFKGKVKIMKYWRGYYGEIVQPLESVAQVLELGADVLKVHMIDKYCDVYSEKERLEEELFY
jgi:hypothetical protein